MLHFKSQKAPFFLIAKKVYIVMDLPFVYVIASNLKIAMPVCGCTCST